MLVQILVQKVINNEIKTLADHEIIDPMAEQIEAVIT